MSRRFADLRRLMQDCRKNGSASAKAIAPLGPLYAAADDNEFRLADPRTFDHGSVRMTITVATGRDASGLMFLTPAKMRPALLRMLRWRSLGDALRTRYELPLRSRLPTEVRAVLDSHVQDLEIALASALWESVWDHAPDEFLDGPPKDVLYGIRTAIWCFAALVALDDGEARHLAPLIRLFANGVLIDESTDLPGTWVLLTAAP